MNKSILLVACHITEPQTDEQPKFGGFDIKTLGEWVNFLDKEYNGWISIKIEKDLANSFNGIGQVIPAVPADLSIFSNNFSCKKVFNFLRGNDKRLIINYWQFIYLLNLIERYIPYNEKKQFHENTELWIKNINKETFWMDIKVSQQISKKLEEENIGEVLDCSLGEMLEFKEKISPVGVIFNDGDIFEPGEEEKKIFLQREFPYRLILNKKSIKKLIFESLKMKGINIHKDVNVYESLISDDITDLLSKLSL